jgi:hypothetical protein
MTADFLDPDQMDATANAIAAHAAEVESAARDLEGVGAVAVPPPLAGWLTSELADIATTVRVTAVLYLVAAMDTILRAESIRTNQSLATAFAPVGTVATAFAATGFVNGAVDTAGYAVPTYDTGASGFYLNQPGDPTPEYLALLQRGILTRPNPNDPLGGYTPSFGGSSSIGATDNLWTLSDEMNGVTWVGANTYTHGGRTGTFDQVRPDQDE